MLYDEVVDKLKLLSEAEMAQAYLTAMAEKYPERIVKLSISYGKNGRKRRETIEK